MKKIIPAGVIGAVMCLMLAGCGAARETADPAAATTAQTTSAQETSAAETQAPAESTAEEKTDDKSEVKTDYWVVVNKQNPIADNWADTIETVSFTNSVDDEVIVEKKAYEAYLRFKADLEKEGIFVDLDSAFRTPEEQQGIIDRFTEKYGAGYAERTVAPPGTSEHHTGLALDLYLIVDGRDVVLNEELVTYTDIWKVIHEKLPEYGFILRYPEGKEHITGFGYEPWHMRYIDDTQKAKEITEKGQTLEEYLGIVKPNKVELDYSGSDIYSEDELKAAGVQVMCKFASFKGFELHNIRYAGDDAATEDDLKRLNDIDPKLNYVQAVKLLTDFRTSAEGGEGFEPDTEVKDYTWWLAREADDGWNLVEFGK